MQVFMGTLQNTRHINVKSTYANECNIHFYKSMSKYHLCLIEQMVFVSVSSVCVKLMKMFSEFGLGFFYLIVF